MKTFASICQSNKNSLSDPSFMSVRFSSRHGLQKLVYYRLDEDDGDNYTGSWLNYSEYSDAFGADEPFVGDNEIDILLEEDLLYSCQASALPKKRTTL